MRSLTRFACGLVMVMALAGCTGEPADEELPNQESTPTAGTSASGPAEPAPDGKGSAAPADGSQLSAEQLESVLAAVDETESLNAQVIPDAELRAREEEAARRAQDIAVTPEECNVYTESGLEELATDTSRAAMTFAGESSLQPDTVSLSSLSSAGAAIEELQASRDQLNVCSEFLLEISGEEIMTTVSEVGVDTSADDDLSLRTTAQIPGTIQESFTVRAVVGSTVIDVLVGSSADPDADIARAERLANLIVAELRLL